MFDDFKNAIAGSFSRYRIDRVLMSNDRTRIVLYLNVDVVGAGKHDAIVNIMVVGQEKDILKNKWYMVRITIPKYNKVEDKRTELSEKTKREIYEFIKNEKRKGLMK